MLETINNSGTYLFFIESYRLSFIGNVIFGSRATSAACREINYTHSIDGSVVLNIIRFSGVPNLTDLYINIVLKLANLKTYGKIQLNKHPFGYKLSQTTNPKTL